MITQIIKMISSALSKLSDQSAYGTHSLIQEANNNYAQGEYFAHLAAQHHQEFLLHHSDGLADSSLVDSRNAMWSFLNAAVRGHREAQYKLGVAYLNGEFGLERNFSQAEAWLKKAAAQGHPLASNTLNQAYQQIAFS
ncbi:tetratricopeptide repeat protein [Acinetobacter sp. ANC 3813]|uniref:tetratricopeptide repeat protein n=1 Tax=Acinetobacter sp. ANC 3813 TaxID=1977873 RepID=UPI000A33523A|nr:SEL1-like repeat protein [Acinetobacter sp. ANC 3813]OTG89725.1 hypothetical protein B9T34_10970 [Acinetobacter sp. ANC 3813]